MAKLRGERWVNRLCKTLKCTSSKIVAMSSRDWEIGRSITVDLSLVIVTYIRIFWEFERTNESTTDFYIAKILGPLEALSAISL
jgi:hypothetical protein